jgi:hypothetical protein
VCVVCFFFFFVRGFFSVLGRVFNVRHALVYRWVSDFGKSLPEPKLPNSLKGGWSLVWFGILWV